MDGCGMCNTPSFLTTTLTPRFSSQSSSPPFYPTFHDLSTTHEPLQYLLSLSKERLACFESKKNLATADEPHTTSSLSCHTTQSTSAVINHIHSDKHEDLSVERRLSRLLFSYRCAGILLAIPKSIREACHFHRYHIATHRSRNPTTSHRPSSLKEKQGSDSRGQILTESNDRRRWLVKNIHSGKERR